MGKMYQSLKEVVYEMSHRNKNDQIYLAPAASSQEPSMMPKVDPTQQTIAEGFDGLRVALQQTLEMVESESQGVVHVIAAQRKQLAKLESQLAEAAEQFRRKESASDAMEKSLNAKIDALQKDLGEKVEIVQSRESQITDLKLNLDTMSTHIRESESHIREVQEEEAAEHKRAEELREGLNQ